MHESPATLSIVEQSALQTHEAIIARGLQTFYEVGAALLSIRDERLYRETHATFEDYCRERWQMGRNYTNKMISAAEVISNLGTNVPILPANEAQARPLTTLTLEQQQEVWQAVVDSAPDGKVTAAQVQAAVAAIQNKPHVARNSGKSEWYTPPHIIAAVRAVMGEIDCDPASNEIANQIVNARTYYAAEDDGLLQAWQGNVWLNPPYANLLITQFANKFTAEYEAGHIQQACILVNNATETNWFQQFLSCALAICLLDGRVKFLDPDMNPGAPLQGQIVLYVGNKLAPFAEAFGALGPVLYVF